VTVTVSGIFRDIFGLQMELLDRAIRLVADLDEPPEMNPIRARVHALQARGFSRDESTSRIFSNAPGAYGTYIDYMVNLSRWESRQDLAASFLRRKGFTFGKDSAGTDGRHVLQALAEDIEVTVQNLDSAEVSLTDVDHYFEYLGGLTALVESASGQRPPARVLDATSGRLRVRSLEETLRLETRARLLNPKWTEGLLRHGYEGAEEIRKRVEYTFGFSATADAVDPWIYTELHSTYLKDASVRDRLRDANVHAFNALVHRLSEAAERNFWSPTDDESALMTSLQDALEDAIEGVG
jgi:magnesium chelatase subunit H